MADINSVVLIGRLTRDAELKYTANGTAVCRFSIASNYRKKSGDQYVDAASFFDAVLWGRQAEALSQYLVKGKQIALTGELRQEVWTDKSGQKRSKIEILAGTIQLLGSKDGTSGSGSFINDSPSQTPWPSTSGNSTDDVPF